MAIQWDTQPTGAPSTGGIQWDNQSAVASTPQAPQPSPLDGWGMLDRALNTTGNVVNSIFPGKQVGQAIGTLGGLGITAGKETLGLAPKGATAAYDTSAPSPMQVAGDIAQGALTVAAPNIGGGASALGRIGSNTVLGAGLGATGAIAQGKSGGNVAQSAAIGGVLGGGISALSEGVGAIVKNMPTWFTKSALPKLKDNTLPYALENTKVLQPASTLLENSNKAVNSYGNQINSILEHPQYANAVGNGAQPIQDVINNLPNAQLDPAKVSNILKQVAPKSKTIIDNLSNGTATLADKNLLRQELDGATKKVFTDKPTLTFAKQVGHEVANALRSDVQTNAPETVPIFQQFSKELDLNKALKVVVTKNNLHPTFKDIAAGYAGYEAGGIKGALAGLAAERLGGSTGGKLFVAKGAQVLGKSAPALNAIIQGGKAPLINAVTSQ